LVLNLTNTLVEECIVTSTFEAILARIAEVPLKRATIQFNTRAISFKSLLDSHGSSKVEVGIRDGEDQSFDEVVVTTPLGWLKSNKNAFEPRIDDELSTSIDAISIGHLEKVVLLGSLEPFVS
jgi:Flavin containing amine oxidoreductase